MSRARLQRKPAEPRGWRWFLAEFTVVAAGVLAALAGEQAVQWLDDQSEVKEARAALHAEVSRNADALAYAVQEDRCFLAAMDLYANWARGGPRAPDVIEAVRFPAFTSSVWDQVKAGPFTNMPLKERLAFASFYGSGENQQSLVTQDRQLAREIAQATAVGTLDAEDAKALLKATSARRFLGIKIATGENMLRQANALGVRPTVPPASAQRLSHLCQMARSAHP